VGVRSGSGGVNPQHMLSLAAGALLATAFMHLLPEAFESQAGAKELFATCWWGWCSSSCSTRPSSGTTAMSTMAANITAPKWRRMRSMTIPGTTTRRTTITATGHAEPRSGGWAVLAGDSVHAFGDGILIASAFMADLRLGVVASLAVLVHEVPHHMGDLVVLRQTSNNRRAALVKVTLAGAVTALGGVPVTRWSTSCTTTCRFS
jgi:zinc and cadmium transporter